MLWLRWKTLSGSYLALTAASRALVLDAEAGDGAALSAMEHDLLEA